MSSFSPLLSRRCDRGFSYPWFYRYVGVVGVQCRPMLRARLRGSNPIPRAQVPLMALGRTLAHKRRGNTLVWWSLFSGQPLLGAYVNVQQHVVCCAGFPAAVSVRNHFETVVAPLPWCHLQSCSIVVNTSKRTST